MEAFESLLHWVFVWFNFTTTTRCRTVPWRLMLGLVFLLIWHRTVSHLIRQALGQFGEFLNIRTCCRCCRRRRQPPTRSRFHGTSVSHVNPTICRSGSFVCTVRYCTERSPVLPTINHTYFSYVFRGQRGPWFSRLFYQCHQG